MDKRYDFTRFFLSTSTYIYIDESCLYLRNRIDTEKDFITISKQTIHLKQSDSINSLFFYKSRKLFNRTENEYVIFPNLKNPRWIIKNDKRIIKNHGFIIKPSTIKSKLIWNVALIINSLNLFSIFFPYKLLLTNESLQLFKRVFNIGLNSHIGIIYSGALGEFQKFTVQIYNENYAITEFIKLSTQTQSLVRIKNEEIALNKLKNYQLKDITYPTLLSTFDNTNYYGIRTNNILSKTAIVESNFNQNDIKFLKELYTKVGIENTTLHEYLDKSNIDNKEKDFFNSLNFINIKTAYSHGDYTSWNRFIENKDTKVIDWELARFRPLFYDLFFYHFYFTFVSNTKNIEMYLHECFNNTIELNSILPDEIKIKQHLNIQMKLYLLLFLYELLDHFEKNNNRSDFPLIEQIKRICIEIKSQIKNENRSSQ